MATSRDEGRSETAGGLAVYLVVVGTVMKCRRCRREGMGEAVRMVMKVRTTV